MTVGKKPVSFYNPSYILYIKRDGLVFVKLLLGGSPDSVSKQ